MWNLSLVKNKKEASRLFQIFNTLPELLLLELLKNGRKVFHAVALLVMQRV